jgi:1,4-dihydroxy-2-naphthoyl-CoA hydrolase
MAWATAMASRNPDFTLDFLKERVITGPDGDSRNFPVDLGVEPMEVTDERSVGRMAIDRRHLHPGGYVHGGAWVGLADSVAAWQTFRHIDPGSNFTTIEMKLNVFSGGRAGDELLAIAETLHGGRSTHVIEVRVMRDHKLVGNLIVTQFIIPSPSGEEGK